MSKQQIIWTICFVIFFLPNMLYLIVNGYWWLFDGNNPIGDKMNAAGLVAFFSGYALIASALILGVWED